MSGEELGYGQANYRNVGMKSSSPLRYSSTQQTSSQIRTSSRVVKTAGASGGPCCEPFRCEDLFNMTALNSCFEKVQKCCTDNCSRIDALSQSVEERFASLSFDGQMKQLRAYVDKRFAEHADENGNVVKRLEKLIRDFESHKSEYTSYCRGRDVRIGNLERLVGEHDTAIKNWSTEHLNIRIEELLKMIQNVDRGCKDKCNQITYALGENEKADKKLYEAHSLTVVKVDELNANFMKRAEVIKQLSQDMQAQFSAVDRRFSQYRQINQYEDLDQRYLGIEWTNQFNQIIAGFVTKDTFEKAMRDDDRRHQQINVSFTNIQNAFNGEIEKNRQEYRQQYAALERRFSQYRQITQYDDLDQRYMKSEWLSQFNQIISNYVTKMQFDKANKDLQQICGDLSIQVNNVRTDLGENWTFDRNVQQGLQNQIDEHQKFKKSLQEWSFNIQAFVKSVQSYFLQEEHLYKKHQLETKESLTSMNFKLSFSSEYEER